MKKKLEVMLLHFIHDGWQLWYNVRLRLPSWSNNDLLALAHDSKISGHSRFTKTLVCHNNFLQHHKT